jgi:transcriptional/translational regulatory protein YebC/TACO1
MPVKLNGTYYTVKEMATKHNVTTRAIEKAIAKGLLKAVELDALFLIESKDYKGYKPPPIGRKPDYLQNLK